MWVLRRIAKRNPADVTDKGIAKVAKSLQISYAEACVSRPGSLQVCGTES
jgi:hypothetical protein